MINKPAPVIIMEDTKRALSSDESIDENLRDLSYRDESYWKLPENVR